MKTALYATMFSALLAAGCLPKPPFLMPEDGAPTGEQAAVQPAPKHISALRADQVTPENAHEMARALEEELESDREAPR